MTEQVEKLITTITAAISSKYKGGCAPGLLISSLPTGEFYVSILSYGTSHKDKKVMFSAKNKDLETALLSLASEFLKPESNKPIDDLKEIVKSFTKTKIATGKGSQNTASIRAAVNKKFGKSHTKRDPVDVSDFDYITK